MVAFISLFFICVWLHQNLKDKPVSAISSEEEISDEILEEETDILNRKIQATLEDKEIEWVLIGVQPQFKEVIVELNGTEDDLKKVKSDIENTLNLLKQKTIFESYSAHVRLQTAATPPQQKEEDKAEEIADFIYGEKGIIKQTDDELMKRGYQFQTLVEAKSLEEVNVKYVLSNRSATHSEKEMVKAIFFEIVRNNHLDPTIFDLEITDGNDEGSDK